ncbi:MAG: GNAT family N-acetyltransferase [Phycisphaeraceae bacterium]|nr:GNAT family N-acetyltransferase [Phycisphaeraceae bacterium]
MGFEPRAVTLQGASVRLEPLALGHAPDLLSAADEDAFRYATQRPESWTLGAFERLVCRALEGPDRIAFAVVDLASGRAIGSTSYLNVRAAHRGLEIGSTWIGPAWRGTRANPEMKLLLLDHAFESLGAWRVELRADARNERSRRAILGLGATFEGILRRHMLLPDGHVRDTALFSVLDGEWPAVRARLLARLESVA